MTSVTHMFYVADGVEVEKVIAKEIEKARSKEQPLSFFALAPMHHVHEKHLCTVIKRVLASTNSRAGTDRVIREAENFAYFVTLGAPVDYVYDLTERLNDECKAVGLRYTGSVMYLPKKGTIEEQAREVYDCLKAGIEDHRRKLPFIYPAEVTQDSGSLQRA